jgi:hypothetical protein
MRSKNLPAEKWTSAELSTMIHWHKQPYDAAIPSKKMLDIIISPDTAIQLLQQ